MTRSSAAPETVPAGVATAALTVARPSTRPAVNMLLLPAAVASFPMLGGRSDQLATTGKTFPKASVPVAASCREARAWTLTDLGVTATAVSALGVTVTTCVPLVAPTADAVSVCAPDRVSW